MFSEVMHKPINIVKSIGFPTGIADKGQGKQLNIDCFWLKKDKRFWTGRCGIPAFSAESLKPPYHF
jgi:hypothetical protein